MKRSLSIYLVLIFLVPTIMKAQLDLSLGPVMGLNYNIHNYSDGDYSVTGTGCGLVLGAQCDMSFSKSLGMVATVLLYDGRFGSGSDSDSKHDMKFKVGYLSIEPLFKYTLPQGKMHLMVGPTFGVNTSNSLELKYNYRVYHDNNTYTWKDSHILFGLKGGAGFDIQLKNRMTLTPQLMVSYGILRSEADYNWNIVTIQALCALKFDLIRFFK